MSCNLTFKIESVGKYFYFFILKCQDLVLKVICQAQTLKVCYPELV